ncbi:hypothetical protein MAR_018626 [Mya arenaria]|uniref:Uncharacterized protein n=1 Tax=Mya arenaria TaxID=6604 RepID=A0ABY7EF70_MYAAR|nr:hypothetical protein MAR_018626 [Mya arenaria]
MVVQSVTPTPTPPVM